MHSELHSLDLEITGRCDQACPFCYLGTSPLLRRASATVALGVLRRGGDMEYETADAVLDLAATLTPPVNLNFTGGEPFLNWPTIPYIREQAEHRGIVANFTIFTNGAAASVGQVEYCLEHRILPRRSTAGCQEAADLVRNHHYTKRWLAEGERWRDYADTHRLVVTAQTARYVLQSVRWLHENGYYGPIDLAADEYATWSLEVEEALCSDLQGLTEAYVTTYRSEHPVRVENFEKMGKSLYGQGDTISLGCGASCETVGVTWDGRLVPCHRFFRDTENQSSTNLAAAIRGEPIIFGPSWAFWINDNASGWEEDKCRACEARQCCTHGCPHLSLTVGKSIHYRHPFRCNVTRFFKSLVDQIHAALSPVNPRWWERSA